MPMDPPLTVKSSAAASTGRPVDGAEAGDQAVARQVVQPADQGTQLGEDARVEEQVEALAGVELALGVLALDPLRPAHGPGRALAPAQLVEQRPPAPFRWIPRHGLGSTGPPPGKEGDRCPTHG